MAGRNISYVKPPEPNFLKRLKEQVGFQEGPTIETKKERLPRDNDEDGDDLDDEKPVVVVLGPGDLSQEEAEKVFKELNESSDPTEDKVKFRKPEKRLSTENINVTSSTTKKMKFCEKEIKTTTSTTKKVKNKCLLSFDDEEHDDDC